MADSSQPPSEEIRDERGSLATMDGRDRGRDGKGRRATSETEQTGRREAGGGGSFFEIYKPGQGHYTRLCTAIGAGILIASGSNFLYNELSVFRDERPWTLWLQVGIPAAWFVGLGLLTFWVVGRKRGSCDFFINTEGEMKKVSWSTRNEIVGSTKVVIVCTLMLACLLFVADAMFINFFTLIGVLGAGAG